MFEVLTNYYTEIYVAKKCCKFLLFLNYHRKQVFHYFRISSKSTGNQKTKNEQ